MNANKITVTDYTPILKVMHTPYKQFMKEHSVAGMVEHEEVKC